MNMPDQFDDVLERLDVTFDDFGPGVDIFDLLHNVLGRMPTQLQADIALQKLQTERQIAFTEGLRIDRFVRRGEQVIQLRDARGRFVASGAAAIGQVLRSR